MKRVPLRNRAGETVAEALVDDADYEWASGFRWHLSSGYAARDVDRRKTMLHRELLGLDHGDPREGDHRNCNRLDNRRSNLRIVTKAENQQNRAGAHSDARSAYRGVDWHKGRAKWRARATVEGRETLLGYFDNEDEAGRVAEAWRKQNVPMEREVIDPVDLRSFPPVDPLSDTAEAFRQTVLSKFSNCPRDAYLYLKYRGGAWSHPLAGGVLLHRTFERFVQTLAQNGETSGPPELIKDILNEVLVESTDITVPADRFDQVRSMCFHIAEGMAINPDAVFGVEVPVEMDVAGRRVTGQIDFVEQLDPTTMLVLDLKSAFMHVDRGAQDGPEYVPTKEEWAGSFQTILYALALATGRVAGSPFALDQTQEFVLRQIHPRTFFEREGTFAYREARIPREALLDWGLYLEAVVERFSNALETWEFPAIQGHHCTYCAASAECPIPAAHRNFRGEIRTPADAERAANLWEALGRRRGELWDAMKGYAQNDGKIRYGKDLVLEWRKVESEKVKAKAVPPGAGTKKIKGITALRSAIDITERFGIPVIWEDYVDKSVSTRLSRRKLTDAELTKERESTP